MSTEARVRAEQIRAQYASMPASFLGSVFSSTTYLLAAHTVIPTWQWMLWAGLMLAQALGRGLLWRAYRRAAPGVDDTDRWARWAIAGSAASGCIWGLGTWLVFPAGHIEYQLFFMFLIASMGSLSAIASASYLPAFYAYTFPTIVPIAVALVFQDALMLRILGLISLGYLPVISTFAHNLGRSVIESFRLRFENLDLLREVTLRKEQVEEASREKSMFLAAASHDLRQPLHALALQTHLLQSAVLPPPQQRVVADMRNSIQAMTGLFDALLDMSRLDAGVIPVRPAPLTLADVFARLETEFGQAARERGLRLRWRGADATVHTDGHLLASLLGNLVSNAIRYTERGGVLVAARRRKGQVRIEVWDSGVGISGDQQRAVFKPFFQIGNVERDRSKGLGLGLAIVERLARLLATPLELASVPGRGTRFSVTLPSAVLPAPSPAVTVVPASPGQGQLAGATVVLVDNEVEIRAAMDALLASWQCEVVTASGVEDALVRAAAMSRAPDLLVCDYRLGADANGLEVIERIRDEFNQPVPALVITGDTGADVLHAVEAARCAILHKPVDPQTLYRTLWELRQNPAG